MEWKLQSFIYLLLLQIPIEIEAVTDLFSIMNHKIFDGCIINILSDFRKNYFPSEFETGTSFVLDKTNGTWHRFRVTRDTSPINLIWMAARRTDPCIIFVVDLYALPWYPDLFYVLYGLADQDLDPHFILIHSRWPGYHLLPSMRVYSYYVTSTILLWDEPRKALFRMCTSVGAPIPILPATLAESSRGTIRILPPLEKSLAHILHLSVKPESLSEEILSCSARYSGLATFFPTCTAYVLSTHFNYSLVRQYKGQQFLAYVMFGEPARGMFYKNKFPARSIMKVQLLNHAIYTLEFRLVIYTKKRGGS